MKADELRDVMMNFGEKMTEEEVDMFMTESGGNKKPEIEIAVFIKKLLDK